MIFNSKRGQHKVRRRILGIPVAWLVGVAGTGLAVVGFFVVLNVTGSVTVRDGIDMKYTQILPPAGPIVGTPTCTYSLTDPEHVNIVMSNAFPGDVCQYKVEVRNDGGVPAFLRGFNVTDPNLIATVNHGITGCGAQVPAGGGIIDVVVRITVAPTAMPGDSFNFAPGDGWEFGINADPACT